MISEDQIQQFERDGAIILRDVIGAHWIDRMRTAIDTVMADPGGLSSNMTGDGGGRFYGDFFLWRHNPEFRAFIFDSPLAALAGEMMRSRKVNFFYEQLLVKEPGTAARTPWHQDLPYWCVGGWQVVSVWVPFDRATPDNGVVSYVRGSHKWGKLYRPAPFGPEPRSNPEDDEAGLEFVPDIDARPQDFEFVTGILEPGDVFVHHARTIHGAPGNATANQRRRALATRWTGADAYFEERPGNFLRGNKFGWLREFAPAAAGDPMDSDLFPVVIP